VPNFDAPESPAGRAKRVLFALGLEMPGRRAIAFAVVLRSPPDGTADAPAGARIRRAVAAIEDGPIALVAENPELGGEPLPVRATSVGEAAEAVVLALGQRIVDAPDPPPRPSAPERR